MGFVTPKVIVYWVLRGQQGSIPFTRFTFPPLIMNRLQLHYYEIRTQILTTRSMSFEIYSEADSYYAEVKFIEFLPLKTIEFVLILKF